MKTLIVYDSYFGNTEKVALAIRNVLGNEALAVRVRDVKLKQLSGLDALIVGSPTRAFKATGAITGFLKQIPARSLTGVKAAAFDTRMDVTDITSRLLEKLVRWLGYAAEPIAARLQKKGARLAVKPAGFSVQGSEGPLKTGELERAVEWAKQIG